MRSFIAQITEDKVQTRLLRAQSFYNQAGTEFLADVKYFYKSVPEGIEVLECTVFFYKKALSMQDVYDDLKRYIQETEGESIYAFGTLNITGKRNEL